MGQRVVQCQQMVDYFESNYLDIPVFIGGDFNEEPQNQPIAEVMNSGFGDLFPITQQTVISVKQDQAVQAKSEEEIDTEVKP